MTILNSKSILSLCVTATALLSAAPETRASDGSFPPPISYTRARSFNGSAEAFSQFLAQQRAESDEPGQARTSAAPPLGGGTWTALAPAHAALGNPLLLTDGTVMLQSAGTQNWLKLTPDINGDYANGTFSRLASLPVINGTQYAPLYHSSGVLPDGRVIIMGGEYNLFTPIWTNMGAIYDPVANAWIPMRHPPGWPIFPDGTGVIGDAQAIVLADGTYMQGACCLLPAGNALLDAASLTWTSTGAPRLGNFYQDEQGYTLLPNGKVLTVDIWTDFDFNTGTATGEPTNAEIYEPKSGLWTSAGNMPVSVVDPSVCGNFEIGPAVMRPDGTLVQFGGNSGCKAAASKVDPTAIYNVHANSWTAGPDVPQACGINGTRFCNLADAPAALLPNGNILFAASAGFGGHPTHFFEFGADNSIIQVPDTLMNSSRDGAFVYNFLVLPTGQILMTDFSNVAELYTPTGSANPKWAPKIREVPTSVNPGGRYTISGTQFSGLSSGAAYGDDNQMATNYPIVRITNAATGHVFFARTTDFSTMSIAPGTQSSSTFTVPGSIETGPSELVVIANGIASQGVAIAVD